MEAQERIDKAVGLMLQYGWVDGDHHKLWVINQALLILMGQEAYNKMLAEAETEGYDAGTGIAP